MKPYKSLCVEILRFDAQDIVTASAACICYPDLCNPNNDGTHRDAGGFVIDCPATSHSCNRK